MLDHNVACWVVDDCSSQNGPKGYRDEPKLIDGSKICEALHMPSGLMIRFDAMKAILHLGLGVGRQGGVEAVYSVLIYAGVQLVGKVVAQFAEGPKRRPELIVEAKSQSQRNGTAIV